MAKRIAWTLIAKSQRKEYPIGSKGLGIKRTVEDFQKSSEKEYSISPSSTI